MSRQYQSDDPWGRAVQGLSFLGNAMRTGQQIGETRYLQDERDNENKAFEYIAGKLGSTGDLSALDGDSILNTRQGTMALGKFMEARANTEQSRLGMLQRMETSDDLFYQNTFRPMAFAAQEAFKAGDMNRFAGIASELSAKSPLPFRLAPAQDGNFTVEFRSDAAGGWADTGSRLTPQQAMDEIGNIIDGEQTVLSGADMKEHRVNPRFLAAAARHKMGTILGNANNLADPKKWIPLTKGGDTVYAIPQNRHDDYSVGPSYRVLDEKRGQSGMIGSMDDLLAQGYVRADVKAQTERAARLARGEDATGRGRAADGGTGYNVSDSDRKFMENFSTITDIDGNRKLDPVQYTALEILMGQHGLSRGAAVQAMTEFVQNAVSKARNAQPGMTDEQLAQAAQRYFLQNLTGGGKQNTASVDQQTQPSSPAAKKNRFQEELVGVAGGVGAGEAKAASETASPEAAHRTMVDGLAGGLKATPQAMKDGWDWYWNSMKQNAE